MNYQILQEDLEQFAKQFELWEQLHSKSFLITGATGLIGSVLTKCLLELNREHNLGIKIFAVVRDIEKARKVFADEFCSINFLESPITDICSESVITPINYIIHLASPTEGKYMEEHPDKEKAVYGQSDLDAMIYHQSSGNADHVRAANTALTQGKEEGVIPQKDINRAKIEQAYHYANEGNYDKAIAGLNKDEIAQLDAMLQENGKKSLVNSDLSLRDKS